MKNPSLREQPREQNAPILASDQDASILGWLEGTGRLMDRTDASSSQDEEEDGEDINSLISGDDKGFDEEEEETNPEE